MAPKVVNVKSERDGWRLARLPRDIFGEIPPGAIYLLRAVTERFEIASTSFSKLSPSKWMPYNELCTLLKGGNRKNLSIV
ncbi:MAG: hypothetical protein ABWK01_01635 [Infirmifilum sp.]